MPNDTLLDSTSTPATPAPAAPAAAPATDPAAAATPPAADPAAAPKGPQGAPEAYEAFVAPEGVTIDQDVANEFTALAKENNLTQAAAQKLFELGAKQSAKLSESLLSKTAEVQAKWETDAKADKEFGGEKLAENLAVAGKALDAYASPELKALLGKFDQEKNPNGTSLGNHPEIIRLFLRVGQAMAEDKLVTGSPTPAKPSTFSYSNSKHN
jgi:hypothetical protein